MHSERDEFADRSTGSLLGLAIGDALGAAVEFKPVGTFVAIALADSLSSVGSRTAGTRSTAAASTSEARPSPEYAAR